jgi:hypothetical protein
MGLPLALLSLMLAQYLFMAGINCCERSREFAISILHVTFQNVRERSSAIYKGRKLHQTGPA